MTKSVKICMAIAIVLFFSGIIAAIILRRPPESTWVEIVQDGKVLYTIDLAEYDDETTQTIRIDSADGGYNIIEISEGNAIRISEADCPDKTCVKTGYLRSENIPIVCLPHKLVIKYTSKPNGDRK
ncbi:MAG: NusG domain II-containing protein [Ruminococcus sp.]|nr:NusG domain II-containing protein [Ruminococcus sp.]